ncbi:hypothetical protein LCGC14_0622220 [marine sediment metagenome]|uniref:Uncharacterized protein n=1 Tax=marine sediment metagenome TaxID=412755 RepID=A0A0F9TQU9_9ZZZZ
MDDIVITPGEVEDFKKHPVWRAMVNALKERISTARDKLEIMGEDIDRNEISHVQGEIYSLRTALELPDTLSQDAEVTIQKGDQNV